MNVGLKGKIRGGGEWSRKEEGVRMYLTVDAEVDRRGIQRESDGTKEGR